MMIGVIIAQENIYALWEITDSKSRKSYFEIEKVIAFHYTCNEDDAFLKPICLNTELSSDCSEQIVFYGTKEQCEEEKKEYTKINELMEKEFEMEKDVEMRANVSNKS